MTSAVHHRRGSWLALLAVALLAWAGVRSTVMQARMAAPVATCGGMAGMAMDGAPGRPVKSAPAKPARCDFCAAAAHVPIETAALRIPPRAAVTTFTRYEAPARLGPRGPPALRPRARGPPLLLSA